MRSNDLSSVSGVSPAPGEWSVERTVVVDSEDREARRTARFLMEAGHEVHRFRAEEGAYNLIDELGLDNLVAEARSPRIDGVRLAQVARRRNPELCTVLIVGPGEESVGTRAMNDGVHDYQRRPLNLDKLLAVMRRAAQHRRLVAQLHELAARLDRKYGLENIVGHSAPVVSMVARVRRLASLDIPVLLWGEPGTGKAMLARVLHQQSSRREGALVALDARGSLMDEVSAMVARIETARGGSVYVEDIDVLSIERQRRLLEALEVPARQEAQARTEGDVPRLLASTTRDLRESVDAGLFLEDLYLRFSAGVLEVPPLRHRRADIPLMIEHFLREFSGEFDHPALTVTPEAMARFVRYSWPENVRELKSVVRGLAVAVAGAANDAGAAGEGGVARSIGVPDLPPVLQDVSGVGRGVVISPSADWREAQRALIEAHLEATGFDREATARSLGISVRTLYRRMAEFGIDVPRRAWKPSGEPDATR